MNFTKRKFFIFILLPLLLEKIYLYINFVTKSFLNKGKSMKINSKITFFLLSILLISSCFGVKKYFDQKEFQTKLEKFLTDSWQLYPGKFKDFFAKYEDVVVEKILNGEIDPDKPIQIKDDYGKYLYDTWLIYRVIQVGNIELLKAIITKSPNMLNFTDGLSNPLLIACENKDIKCVEYLLDQGADPIKMFIPPLENTSFIIHPMSYFLSGIMEQKDVANIKTILDLISKKSPEFLTYNFYDQTCLSEVEKIISTNSGDPKLVDSIKYWTEIQEFIKSKIKGN
jgi:hypothetical protein